MCLATIKATGEVLGSLAPAAEWVGDRLQKWQDDRDRLAALEMQEREARLNAEVELAAWKVKADHEWSFEWAKQAGNSWKDEYLTILFTLPLILLFIPTTRPWVLEGFEALKYFHPDAPTWFMGGAAVVVSAAFGMKQALNFMLPARFAALAGVMSAIPDDIPSEAVKAIPNPTKPATR